LTKITLFERLKSPKSACKTYKGLISSENQVIGAYIYGSRGQSPRNMVVGAELANLKEYADQDGEAEEGEFN
jgi:hypothetical protein